MLSHLKVHGEQWAIDQLRRWGWAAGDPARLPHADQLVGAQLLLQLRGIAVAEQRVALYRQVEDDGGAALIQDGGQRVGRPEYEGLNVVVGEDYRDVIVVLKKPHTTSEHVI